MSINDGLPRHTRTVKLSELVERVVHSAYGELQALATNLPGQPEADRKRELARYLHNLRQRLVRLAVIAEWAPTQRVRRRSLPRSCKTGALGWGVWKLHTRTHAPA